MGNVICIDTETGGFSPFTSALCSVTMKVVGEDIMKTIYIKPTPKREYHPKAMQVNGMTKERLENNGVSEEEAADQIEDFIKTHGGFKPIFLAHNVIFDAQFMNALFQRTKQKMFTEMMHYHPQ